MVPVSEGGFPSHNNCSSIDISNGVIAQRKVYFLMTQIKITTMIHAIIIIIIIVTSADVLSGAAAVVNGGKHRAGGIFWVDINSGKLRQQQQQQQRVQITAAKTSTSKRQRRKLVPALDEACRCNKECIFPISNSRSSIHSTTATTIAWVSSVPNRMHAKAIPRTAIIKRKNYRKAFCFSSEVSVNKVCICGNFSKCEFYLCF